MGFRVGLDLRLEAKLSQRLVMTPRMQQALELLQYNHLEMVTHVQEALLENPTLEAVPDSDGGGDDYPEARPERPGDVEPGEGGRTDEGGGNVDWEQYIRQMGDETKSSLPSVSGGSTLDELPPIETNLTYGETLSDHLLWQLRMLRCTEDEERLATALIHNLDERGYLEVPLEEIAAAEEVSVELAMDALEIVWGLDPIGCGARDLCECLVIQARFYHPHDDDFARILVPAHLANLERRNYPGIAKDLKLDVEDVIEYHRMIMDLEPHPGRGFGGSDSRYITPDLSVVKRGDGWEVLLNEEGLPDLRISKYYEKVLKSASKADKEYLIDKLRGAEFLIKSIHKRRRTIKRVMESIIKYQPEFFEKGPGHLRPLILQDIADDVEVHMSTVSRVTTNKYVHTPHGILELKYFFTAAVRQQSGEDLAAEAIKKKIKSLIDGESGKDPLSDQAIAEALKASGVDVARRTVAKYREAMGILPSSKRKRLF